MASTAPLELRRSRSFGDILNLTFEFLRYNFKIIFKSVIFLAGPPVIIAAGLIGTSVGLQPDTFFRQNSSFIGVFFVALVFFMMATILAMGAVTEIVNIRAYEQEKEITFDEVWEATRRDFMMLLVTSIGYTILVALGSVLFIIPGIYLLTTLSMILIVRVHEGLDFGQAISRCTELIKGYWWFTFGLLFVVNLVMGVLTQFILLPLQLLVGAGSFFSTSDGGNAAEILVIVIWLVSAVVRFIVYVFVIVAASLQYFNLVEKQEGYGLMERIDSIGDGGPVQEGNESSW